MKAINYLLLFTAIGEVLTSCQNDNSELSSTNSNLITITAEKVVNKSNDSRASIDDLDFTWITGDKLSVYNSANLNETFSLNGDGGGLQGDFQGKLEPNSNIEPVYAIYPYKAGNTFDKDSDGVVTWTATLDENQIQKHDVGGVLDLTSLGQYTYLAGKTEGIWQETNNISMKMSQFMAVFDFRLSDLPAETTVYSVVLRSNTAIFPTSAKVNFTADGTAPAFELGATMCNQIEVKLQTGDQAGVTPTDGKLIVRMAMLPQTFVATSTWDIDIVVKEKDATDQKVYMFPRVLSNPKTFDPGVRYYTNYSYSSKSEKPLVLKTIAGFNGAGFDAGPSTLETAKFHNPHNMCIDDDGVIYIAERCSHTIKKITKDGTVSVFAGRFIDNDPWGGSAHYQNGDLLTAEFNSPADIVYAGNNTFYVADFMNNAVRMIKDGQVTTFGNRRLGDEWTNVEIFAPDRKMPLSQFRFSRPAGLLYDKASNCLYVSSHSHYVVRINLSEEDKKVEHVGGKMFHVGAVEGAIGTAKINSPRGMALDSKGNLYVANEYAQIIVKIDNQLNHTRVAGWPDTAGAVDGDAATSRLNRPMYLICDKDDNVLIADSFNHCIRKYDDNTGLLSTWAGELGSNAVIDGELSIARMSYPTGLIQDISTGKIYISQTEGNAGIRVFEY